MAEKAGETLKRPIFQEKMSPRISALLVEDTAGVFTILGNEQGAIRGSR